MCVGRKMLGSVPQCQPKTGLLSVKLGTLKHKQLAVSWFEEHSNYLASVQRHSVSTQRV